MGLIPSFMDRTESGLRAGLSPWLTDIAAAESESSHTSKEGRKVLVVAAAAPPFSVVVGMGNIGFCRSRERREEGEAMTRRIYKRG